MPKLNASALERDPRLRRLTDFISEHYDESIPLKRAATLANLEVNYFCRYFHEKTGVTYLSWLSWIRVQRTIRLIENTRCSVTSAAMKCGFSDLRSCQRAFIRHTGKTASEVRRIAQESANGMAGIFGFAPPIIAWLDEYSSFCARELSLVFTLLA